MKRLACKTQLSLKDFMCKARKVATAQCSMVPESVAAECFPDAQATQGKTRERFDGGVGGFDPAWTICDPSWTFVKKYRGVVVPTVGLYTLYSLKRSMIDLLFPGLDLD
jgi:hypothetical protein